MRRIAIGNPKTVPAGQYTEQLLNSMKLWDQLQPKLVFAEDVRQVYDYVARGEVDAGVVYSSDAAALHAPGVYVYAEATQQGLHDPLVYPIAVVKDSQHAGRGPAVRRLRTQPRRAKHFDQVRIHACAAHRFKRSGAAAHSGQRKVEIAMIWSALKVSLLVVAVATIITSVLGLALAFLLARRNFRGKELLDAVLTTPLVLPPTVTGYYLIVLLGRRGLLGAPLYAWTGWTITFTWQAAALAATVVALPLMIKAARAAIESVEPKYELASYTLGKSELTTFMRVTLPLARRGIVAGIVLSAARALGEFGATLMLAGNIPGRTQTMPLAIFEAVVSGDDRRAQLLALLLTFISITAIYLTNRLTRATRAHAA